MILHPVRPVRRVRQILVAGVLTAAAVLVIAILGAGPGPLGTHRSGASPAPTVARFRIGESEASVRMKLGPPASTSTRRANGKRVDSWYYGTLPRQGPYTFVFVDNKLR